MDQEIYHLLYDVPESADYAVDSSDLDAEDIPEARVAKIKNLLSNSDMEVKFTAARILTSWGYEEGLNVLEEFISKPEDIKNWMPNRLYGFNDSFKYILMSLNRFVALGADKGKAEYAKRRVYLPIKHIIEIAKTQPFNIDYFLSQIKKGKYDEFIPDLKALLEAIIDHQEIHGWKIYDVIELLLRFDPEFINNLLKEKGKTINDFDLSPRRYR